MNTDLKLVLVFVFVILASWILGFVSGRVSEAHKMQRMMRRRFIDFADEMHQETAKILALPKTRGGDRKIQGRQGEHD